MPGNVAIDLISDRTQTIRASVADVQFTLLLSVSLVVGVIFVFLRKAWATIIPAVVVPVSIIGTFAGMYLFGYSLDNLSLMGLTIAVGFLVDDAIVMIENIVRYIEAGETPFAAAVKGAGQMGFTILSITLSLVAAFIPLLLMGGIVGRLFREFAVTVTMAILLSGAIALTLTPVMCAQFLKRETRAERGPGRWAEAGFNALLHGYDRGLRFVLRHQFPALLLTIALLFLSVALYVVVPKGFFPQQDTGFIYGEADGSEDISFAGMRRLTEQLRDVIRQDPAVASVGTFLGATGGNASENAARLMIQLKPYDRRDVNADQVIARLRQRRGASRRHQVLHAGGTGYQCRRPDVAHAVSIHADRHQQRRTQPLGTARVAAHGGAARFAGRGVGPTDRRVAPRADHRSCHRGTDGRVDADGR